jgi:hypothetical protein
MNLKRLVGALGLLLVACSGAKFAGFPVHGLRAAPPTGIEATAAAVGAPAPALSLPTDQGTTWTLADAVKTGPQVVVFYRGRW